LEIISQELVMLSGIEIRISFVVKYSGIDEEFSVHDIKNIMHRK
jgi:hypothetical protein